MADAFKMTKERVIVADAPDVMTDQVGSYRVVVQKSYRDTSEEPRYSLRRWAFQISKKTGDAEG